MGKTLFWVVQHIILKCLEKDIYILFSIDCYQSSLHDNIRFLMSDNSYSINNDIYIYTFIYMMMMMMMMMMMKMMMKMRL